MSLSTVQIIVTGKVQGVCFRINTKAAADQYNVTGLVQNKPDGTVHIIATGKKESLQKFKEWCKQGDPPAKVNSVFVTKLDPVDYRQFEIMR